MSAKRNARFIAMIGLSALVGTLATACSPAKSDGGSTTRSTANSSQPQNTTAPATKQLATATWNLPYEPASLDPIKTQLFADSPVTSNLCETLLKVNPDLSVSPNLAVSYHEVNSLTWTYQIRTGVHFWDGQLVTAADVAASLNRNLDPKSGSYWSIEFANVKSITVSGTSQITIHLTHPDALVNQVLATSAGAVSESSFLTRAGSSYGTAKTGLMCTGPFRFVSWKPGDSITIARNDAYWNKANEPKTQKIVFRFVSDPATIASGLITGEIDGMYQLPPASIPQLQSSSSGHLYVNNASTASLDLIPTERPGPMHNVDVRQALFAALDRSAIATGVFHSAATPAVSFINPGVGYGQSTYSAYLKSRPKPAVDLSAARALIAKDPEAKTPIKLATSPDPSFVAVANAIAQTGNSLGMNITVVTLTPAENDNLYFDQKLRDNYDAFLNEQWTMTTDPLEELEFVTPTAFTNYGQYANPGFLSLFYAALGVTDPTQRAEAAVKAVAVVDKDLPWVPIVNIPVTTYIRNDLTGVPTSWAFLYGEWAQTLGGR